MPMIKSPFVDTDSDSESMRDPKYTHNEAFRDFNNSNFKKPARQAKKSIGKACILFGVSYGCAYFGKGADGFTGPDEKLTGVNTYTQAHRDIAVKSFWLFGLFYCLCAVVEATKRLMIWRFTKCGRFFILPLLIVMRTIILIYFFYFILYLQVFPICKTLYHLNNTNWWKSSTEPFFTNSSIFCAAACWFLWVIFWCCYIFILVNLFVIVFLFFAYMFLEKESCAEAFSHV